MAGKKFSFRLQSVLRLRHHETEAARERLARAGAAVREQEAAVEAERRRYAAVAAARPADFSAGSLHRLEAHRTAARAAVAEAEQRLEHLRKVEAEARERLTDAHRDEEVLSTLRDRQRNAFLKARATAEAAALDEQALAGYVRQHFS